MPLNEVVRSKDWSSTRSCEVVDGAKSPSNPGLGLSAGPWVLEKGLLGKTPTVKLHAGINLPMRCDLKIGKNLFIFTMGNTLVMKKSFKTEIAQLIDYINQHHKSIN